MMKMRNFICCFLLVAGVSPAASTPPLPKFDEIYRVLSTNLGGLSQDQLDHAAVQGLLDQLGPSVSLIDDPAGAARSQQPALGQSRLFDDSFAYFRVGAVSSNLPDAFLAAYQQMIETNKDKIKGIALDLRFAAGADYAAAAKVVDFFLNSERPLLDWQSGSAHATQKTNAILLPVVILVNARTSGAAEALAAMLRETDVGLVLGSTTAGRASIFKEFALSNGAKLRVAVATVTLGGGKALTQGLSPDIAVDASLADEEAWLHDPYKNLHAPETARTDATDVLPQPRPRFNEAELVREHNAGEDEDTDEDMAPDVVAPGPPTVADPVLARALDLLKGLAVIQPARPG